MVRYVRHGGCTWCRLLSSHRAVELWLQFKRNLINSLNDEICGLASESGKIRTHSILLYEMGGSVEDM